MAGGGGSAKPAGPAAAAKKTVTTESMTVEQVGQYLQSVVLGKYSGQFAKSGIDGAKLMKCSDADLCKAGMTFRPHRRKLLKLLHGENATGQSSLVAKAHGQAKAALYALRELRETLKGARTPLPIPNCLAC